ncbi:MAG TPA: hypothetical protein VI756_00920 [Blastocatellia bacterium]
MAELPGYMSVPTNPHYRVSIGADVYDSWTNEQLIKQMTVELTTNLASEGLVRFFDPVFAIEDKYTVNGSVPQLTCLFWMGFGPDLGAPIFQGLLIRTERGDMDTTFRCYDMSYKMRQQVKAEYQYNKHDLQVIQILVTRNGLLFEGPDNPPALVPHKCLPQSQKNDWKHGHRRSKDAGLVLYCRNNTVYAKQPAVIGSPLVTLTYRKDFVLLHNWDATYKMPENTHGRNKHVQSRGRNKGGHRLSGDSNVNARGTENLSFKHDLAIHEKAFADRKAQAQKDLQREHAFVVNVRSVPPLPNVRPDNRDTIALANCGLLWSGSFLIDKVQHDGVPAGFSTQYTLYRDVNP